MLLLGEIPYMVAVALVGQTVAEQDLMAMVMVVVVVVLAALMQLAD
jgi:hypothetical protein